MRRLRIWQIFCSGEAEKVNSTIWWYYKKMNRKQRNTYDALFTEPIRRNIL
jgi:hypothetical protein